MTQECAVTDGDSIVVVFDNLSIPVPRDSNRQVSSWYFASR